MIIKKTAMIMQIAIVIVKAKNILKIVSSIFYIIALLYLKS